MTRTAPSPSSDGAVNVKRVAAHAVADDFGKDAGAALPGVLEFLEDQDAGALSDDETIALVVPGPGSAFRLVVALGQGPHGGEPADAHRRDARLGAAADHDVRIAPLDDAETNRRWSGRWWCRRSRWPN